MHKHATAQKIGSPAMPAKQARHFNEQEHRLLAIWAADCAEHVLTFFERTYPEDDRPRTAIEAVRAWVRGDLPMVDARRSFAAQAAARTASNATTQAAARAAGHAAATAHVVDHAHYAAAQAVKAAQINSNAASAESDWQGKRLPERLNPVLFPTSRH